MTDEFFDEFLYGAVVDQSLLTPEEAKMYQQKNVLELSPNDPFTKL
jgi:aminopeptidase C